MNKCILVHSGNRDNYEVAKALYSSGLLKTFVTDDYVIRKNRPRILAHSVKTSWSALFLSLVTRFLHNSKLHYLKDQVLSRSAYKIIKNNTSLIAFSYSYYSSYLFSHFKGKKVLFQLHPHPASVRQIFLEEIKLNPISKKSLSQEHELLLSEKEFKTLTDEPYRADFIICASTFTKNTLIENGIESSKIKIAAYGVDQDKFKFRTNYVRKANYLKVLFTGSWNQRKGLSYLAAAVKELQTKNYNIELILVGRGITDKSLVDKFELKNVSFHLNISDEELLSLYHAADVFVFPSLCEGFAQVILEAMATGLPVITTDHTAGKDIITDGKDGYIVPIRSVSNIVLKLQLLYENPQVNIELGENAAKTAANYTWGNFRKRIATIIEDIDAS